MSIHAWFVFRFLQKNNIRIGDIKNIFINQGPGKFSGIRTSISVAKALAIIKNINLYGFKSKDLKDKDYMNILELYKKGLLIKNLINSVYSS